MSPRSVRRIEESEGVWWELAQKIFLVYGVISVGYGFLLGLPISRVRMKAPVAPRHLIIAHLASIIQGALHFGFAFAVGFSGLGQQIETLSAILLVAGSALFVTGATLNWLQEVGDHFAARSVGWKLLAVSAPANLTGIGILLVGIVRGL